jgi:hypothetical protein
VSQFCAQLHLDYISDFLLYRRTSSAGRIVAGAAKRLSCNAYRRETMIQFDLDTEHSIVLVRPQSRLDSDDFVKLAQAVDPQIETTGDLAGVIIDAPSFPGWDSFGSMVSHFRFVRDHQKHVKKVAVVTDSAFGDVAEHLASHFVAAEIKHFPAGQTEAARQWIVSGS